MPRSRHTGLKATAALGAAALALSGGVVLERVARPAPETGDTLAADRAPAGGIDAGVPDAEPSSPPVIATAPPRGEPAPPLKRVEGVRPTPKAKPTPRSAEPTAPSGSRAPTTAPPQPQPPTGSTGSSRAARAERAVVAIVNRERRRAGCGPARMDGRLRKAARRHSADMAERGYFAHTSPDGTTFADRIRAAGHPSPGAENIARGQRTAEAVMRAWMDSDGHRRNILNCDLRDIGVGVRLSSGGPWWTQDFGRS